MWVHGCEWCVYRCGCGCMGVSGMFMGVDVGVGVGVGVFMGVFMGVGVGVGVGMGVCRLVSKIHMRSLAMYKSTPTLFAKHC